MSVFPELLLNNPAEGSPEMGPLWIFLKRLSLPIHNSPSMPSDRMAGAGCYGSDRITGEYSNDVDVDWRRVEEYLQT